MSKYISGYIYTGRWPELFDYLSWFRKLLNTRGQLFYRKLWKNSYMYKKSLIKLRGFYALIVIIKPKMAFKTHQASFFIMEVNHIHRWITYRTQSFRLFFESIYYHVFINLYKENQYWYYTYMVLKILIKFGGVIVKCSNILRLGKLRLLME